MDTAVTAIETEIAALPARMVERCAARASLADALAADVAIDVTRRFGLMERAMTAGGFETDKIPAALFSAAKNALAARIG